MALAIAAVAMADDGDARFDILEYVVEGNSRLADIEIERAVLPYLGEGLTIREVEAARAALEKAYHDAGFLTAAVSIPEQQIEDGIVSLSVLEGRVGRLRVKGAEYHLASDIKGSLSALSEGQVPHFPEVQRQLDAINRGADLKATPVLKAGRLPGTVDVTMEVDDQLPLHGNLELNNRQSPGTRPLRLGGAVRYDNLWQLGHSFGFSAQVAPEATEQAQMLAATYVLPVDRQGNALAMYWVESRSNVPGPTSVLNNSGIGGLRYVAALPGSDDYSQSLSLGLDHKRLRAVEGLVGGTIATVLQPPIAYTPLVANYTGSWLQERGSTGIDATATLGMRGLFSNRDSDFDAKRPGASASFLSLKTGLQQNKTFARWAAKGRLEMQLASGFLLPNEQYAAGGAESVRGYLESEMLGDRAARLNLELRTPALQWGDVTAPLRLNGVVFYDAARLISLQYDPVSAASLPPRRHRLRGTGVGVRVAAPGGLAVDLDVARALDDTDGGATGTKAGKVRVHFRLIWDY